MIFSTKVLVFCVYAAICILIGISLVWKGRRKTAPGVTCVGWYSTFLGMFFVGRIAYELLGTNVSIITISEISYYVGWFFLLRFTQITFYSGHENRRSIKLIFIAFYLGMGCSFLVSLLLDITIASGSSVTNMPASQYEFWRFAIDNLFISIIPLLWNVIEGVRYYKRLHLKPADYVGLKYILLVVTASVLTLTQVTNFVNTQVSKTSNDAMFTIFSIMSIVSVFLEYITWFTPSFIARLMHVDFPYIRNEIVEDGMRTRELPLISEPDMLYKQILRSKSLMTIINHFGTIMAGLASRTVAGCNGFLLMALSSEYGDDGIYGLNLASIKHVIENRLIQRMRIVGFQNPEVIRERLLEEFQTNKPFLTMAVL